MYFINASLLQHTYIAFIYIGQNGNVLSLYWMIRNHNRKSRSNHWNMQKYRKTWTHIHILLQV